MPLHSLQTLVQVFTPVSIATVIETPEIRILGAEINQHYLDIITGRESGHCTGLFTTLRSVFLDESRAAISVHAAARNNSIDR